LRGRENHRDDNGIARFGELDSDDPLVFFEFGGFALDEAKAVLRVVLESIIDRNEGFVDRGELRADEAWCSDFEEEM